MQLTNQTAGEVLQLKTVLCMYTKCQFLLLLQHVEIKPQDSNNLKVTKTITISR